MSSRGAIACVVLLLMVVVPVLGVAGDDLPASHRGPHREAGLRHQPPRPWRTAPAAVETPTPLPRVVPLATLDAPEPAHPLLLVVRTPFVPPRD
jgi:hypothetical protein